MIAYTVNMLLSDIEHNMINNIVHMKSDIVNNMITDII